MEKELEKCIENKKFIIIGETHGVQGNIDFLEQFLPIIKRKNEKTAFAFEWLLGPENDKFLREYVHGSRTKDESVNRALSELYEIKSGVFSDQHLEFLNKIREINLNSSFENRINVLFFDTEVRPWNMRDKKMAESVIKAAQQFDTLIISTGSFHACRDSKLLPLEDDKSEKKALISYLPPSETVCIYLQCLSGEYYNFGMKKIADPVSNVEKQLFVNCFDEVFKIQKATPVTFNCEP